MNNIDWDLIRSFLAVARQGSLSAAARGLGASQPTLSRDIAALESLTRLNLFRRTTQGLQLTEAGQSLMEAASRMEEAADLFSRRVSGLSDALTGDVRISVNEIVGVFLLPPALAAFRNRHPGVHVEVVITNEVSSLSKREADIALRMFRPGQPDLVAKRLPDMELGFYATHEYVKKNGDPQNAEAFIQHTLIGYDEGLDFIQGAAHFGMKLTPNHFAIRTDHLLTQIHLVRAGAGITATHVGLAEHWSELVRILRWISLPPLEFWIVCHRDVQFNNRIRALMRFLGEWFADDPYRHAII